MANIDVATNFNYDPTASPGGRVAGWWNYKTGEWGKLKLKVERVNTTKKKRATTTATNIKMKIIIKKKLVRYIRKKV